MSRVSYRMADVLGVYSKEPPESVLKYGDIGNMKWSKKLMAIDITEDMPKGVGYFRAYHYTYPFTLHGGYYGASTAVLKYAIYKKNTAGMEPPVRNLILAFKHLYSGAISFRMGINGAEYLKKAVGCLIRMESYLSKGPENYGLTVFALKGVRHIITGLTIREETEPECMADYDDEEKAEEAEEITEYCMDVLLGMLTKGSEVMPLPEEKEKGETAND